MNNSQKLHLIAFLTLLTPILSFDCFLTVFSFCLGDWLAQLWAIYLWIFSSLLSVNILILTLYCLVKCLYNSFLLSFLFFCLGDWFALYLLPYLMILSYDVILLHYLSFKVIDLHAPMALGCTTYFCQVRYIYDVYIMTFFLLYYGSILCYAHFIFFLLLIDFDFHKCKW